MKFNHAFLIIVSGLVLSAGVALADVTVPCAAASAQTYSALTSGCSEAGYFATFNIISNAGFDLSNLLIVPVVSGGHRGFDLISNGPLTGDYAFNFSLVSLDGSTIKSFTEIVNGTGAGVTDGGYACPVQNTCDYFYLHSWANNTITYNYSPGSSTFLSHEDVNILNGGTYVSVDKVVNITPEPASVVLIGVGLVAIAFLRRAVFKHPRLDRPNLKAFMAPPCDESGLDRPGHLMYTASQSVQPCRALRSHTEHSAVSLPLRSDPYYGEPYRAPRGPTEHSL